VVKSKHQLAKKGYLFRVSCNRTRTGGLYKNNG